MAGLLEDEDKAIDKKEEKRILYDLDIPHEWPEATVILSDTDSRKSLWKILTAAIHACSWFTVTVMRNPTRLLGLSSQPPSILFDLMSSRLPWQLILSSDGRQLAVIQDNVIEIRSTLDNFSTARATIKVSEDPYPQWRKGIWSPGGTSLAYANSQGHVTIYNYNGSVLYQLSRPLSGGGTERLPFLMTAVSGMSFITNNNNTLFVVTTYEGEITTFSLSDNRHYTVLHRVSLLNYFPYGIGSIEYLSSSNLLIIAGWSDEQDTPLIGCWRAITESPYWIPAANNQVKKSRRGTFSSLIDKRILNNNWIYTMSLSPDGTSLATLSLSGSLTIWEVPSCREKVQWTPDELPGSHESHMITTSFGYETPASKVNSVLPIEVTWWSNDSLILVNSLYKVTVLSVDTLINLLGHSPEPGASVTHGYDGQLLMLEGEVYTRVSKKRQLLPSLSDDYEEEEEEGEEREEKEEEKEKTNKEEKGKIKNLGRSPLWQKTSLIYNQVMYFLTEKEQFKPPKTIQKVKCTQYRLVCLKSMPPEECYQRKITNAEYGEALDLAKQYELDTDLVYQRQWQLSVPVTVAAIKDYLSRVKDKNWVLKECLHAVAPDFLTMKEILLYGLHCTSFKELLSLRSEEEEEVWSSITEEQEIDLLKIISQWKSLSEEEIFFCQCRETFLKYLDRLNTYEEILGGPAATFEYYDPQVFGEFRNINLIQACINYAQDGNWEAIEALFDRHGDVVLPYRLAILSHFPETLSFTSDYQYLLPSLNDKGEIEDWECEEIRKKDWVEDTHIRQLYHLSKQSSIDLSSSEELIGLKEYIEPLTSELLTSWYYNRAIEIEEYSGQIDNALALIELGMKNNVKGLKTLEHHLQTLNSLIYHCNADIHLNLTKLQKMSHLDILHLMLQEVEGEQFMIYFTAHAIPYINRLMNLGIINDTSLLEEFMIIISKNDIRPCVNLLKSMKEKSVRGGGKGSSLMSSLSIDTKMSLALKCVYICERTDQLDYIENIAGHFETMIGSKQLSSQQKEMYQQLNDLQNLISVVEILSNYNISKSIKSLSDIKDNSNEAEQLMRRLVRVASRKTPPLQEREWRALQQHLFTLRNKLFCCVDLNTCMKIFIESLICSGSMDNISLAVEALTVTPPHSSQATPITRSFSHALPYETTLDVIIKASHEYVNSATGPKDEEIELARLCLSLIKDDSPLIVSERNFISALDLLNEFDIQNVPMLPINVRLWENKLDLIKQILDSSPTAYKKYDKLFKLSYLLGVSSESDTSLHSMSSWTHMSPGRGHTAIYIALAALANSDYKSTLRICQLLMNCNFNDAWEVTKELGTAASFTDLNAKLDLLNFAVTHCPIEEIHIILTDIRILEAQLLCNECQERRREEMSGSVRQLVGQSVQQIVSKGSGTVQHLIGQRSTDGVQGHDDILLKCLKELEELRATMTDRREEEEKTLLLRYHPFYTTPSSTSTETYTSYRERTSGWSLAILQALIRIHQIHYYEKGEESTPPTLLIDSGTHYVTNDIHMFIGYILSLEKYPKEVEDLLINFISPSTFLYHLSIYYTSLVLYGGQASNTHLLDSHPYTHEPIKLIDHVTSHVISMELSDWPESCHPFISLFHTSRSLLNDFTQASILLKHGIEFNLNQFVQDSSYKNDIIMSLARQGVWSVFDIGLSLCSHHQLEHWLMYMKHLDWLLTESGYLADEINKRTTEHNIMTHLLEEDPQRTATYLMDVTYLSLPPTRYNIILSYYNYLQYCVDKGADVKEDIATHQKLLKKFKTTIREVNYRNLMSGIDPLSVLLPALGDHNIHPIAKLARSIPLNDGGTLTAKMIYAAYVSKVFWRDDNTSSYSTSMWVSRYDTCRDYMTRLDAEHINNLTKDMIFSNNSLKLMSVDTRNVLLDKLIELCTEKKSMEGTKHIEYSFGDLLNELTICRHHLDTLKLLYTDTPHNIDKGVWSGIVKKYDLSISHTDKIHTLCHEVCMLGLPLECIQLLLVHSNKVRSHKLVTKDIVMECLRELVNKESDNSKKIEKIVHVIGRHKQKRGDKMMKFIDIMDILQSYYSNESTRSIELKYSLLKCISQYTDLSEDDSHLLVYYQTRIILNPNIFHNQVLTVDDVSSLDKRRDLVLSLCSSSTCIEQLETLAHLLEQWPTSDTDLFTECWLQVLTGIIDYPEGCGKVLYIRAGLSNFSQKVDEKLFELLWSKDKHSGLLLSLLTPKNSLLITLIKQKKLPPEDFVNFLSNTCYELVLYNRLVPAVIDTPLYSHLCSYLIDPPITKRSQLRGVVDVPLLVRLVKCQEDELFEILCFHLPSGRVERVVQQLKESGYHEEGEQLMTEFTAVQQRRGSSLLGVTSAFRSLKGFFS